MIGSMNDIHNAYDGLDRSMRKIGLQLVDDTQELKGGKPAQFIALVRKLLLGTSTVIAKQLLGRGCPSHSSDKKLIITAFDILRDAKQPPSISVEQFCGQGFIYHKLAVVSKLADYVAKYSGVKPTPLNAYVVVPEAAETSVFDGDALMSPEFLRSATYSSRKAASPITMDSSNSDWPLSDFIRQHMQENKNKDMTREKFKKHVIRSRTLANMAYMAEENIISYAVTNNDNGSAYNSPAPSATKKKQQQQHNSANNQSLAEGHQSEEDVSTLGQQSPLNDGSGRPVSPKGAANGNDILYTQLRSPAAQAGRTPKDPTTPIATPSKIPTGRSQSAPRGGRSATKGSLGSNRDDDGPYSSPPPVFNRDERGNPVKPRASPNKDDKQEQKDAVLHAFSVTELEAEDLIRRLEEKYEARIIDKLEYDFHKKMEAKLEKLIEAKVDAAVKEVTEKYDFIINKLVAAVDTEFTLLHNNLKLAAAGRPTNSY